MADALDASKKLFKRKSSMIKITESAKRHAELPFIARGAHNNDTNLTVAISGMLVEPGKYRTSEDEFPFLTLNHALLATFRR